NRDRQQPRDGRSVGPSHRSSQREHVVLQPVICIDQLRCCNCFVIRPESIQGTVARTKLCNVLVVGSPIARCVACYLEGSATSLNCIVSRFRLIAKLYQTLCCL